MTETNKQRIVKYYSILDKYTHYNYETILLFSSVNKKQFKRSINCAIAEVEEVIEELKFRNLTYAYHQEELAELKSML
jgi:hypothetical protein